MKESTFGKRKIDVPKPKIDLISSCASTCRSDSQPQPSSKKETVNRYRISFVREEIVVANSYEVATYQGHTTLKITFKTDGKTSCIREGVSKIEKL